MRLRFLILAPLLSACLGARPENRRARERIFSPSFQEAPPPEKVPIDLGALPASPLLQDHALGMGEREAAARLGSFRQRGTLTMEFDGRPAGRQLTLTEERLVEQSATGDLHLRLDESSGDGMELVLAAGKLYGRSRYGPFVERDPSEDLDRYRDEVYGALGTVYLLSSRAWSLSPMNLETVGGRECQRFQVARGSERPLGGPGPFEGRLDSDSQKHFEFLYGRALDDVHGTVCLDRETGVPLAARLDLRWTARGDAGTAHVHARLEESIDHVGQALAIGTPQGALPEPHRPRGQAAALERYGFLSRTDGGLLVEPGNRTAAP